MKAPANHDFSRQLIRTVRRRIKSVIARSLLRVGRYTARLRVMPDFLIIGAPKCGTTTLFNYLRKHPYIAYTWEKETNFFDLHFKKGVLWYRGHFPSWLYQHFNQRVLKRERLVGEASPNYLSYPHAVQRVAGLLPRARLVVMLRNPVARAFSHYHHIVRMGLETLSFEDAIESEEARTRPEWEHIIRDEHYDSTLFRRFSYLSKGIYVDQVRPWLETFPSEQILIVRSEDFFADTAAVFRRVTRFLGVPDWAPPAFAKHNAGRYEPMQAATRERLAAFFAPHNRRLYDYLGVDFGWD